jgi:D-psicose/D-tagatose/L-ribulose 3-epimerase
MHNRRQFVRMAGMAALGSLAATQVIQAHWKGFKWAMCNESMKGMSWLDQCALVAKAGFTGIEIAPFTLVQEGVQELSLKKRRQMVTVMNDYGLVCPGLHWLLVAPPTGLHGTTNDETIRRRTWEYIDRLIDFCSDLGGKVMIFGSPKQRSAKDTGISVEEAGKRLADGLAGCADHAKKNDVRILLESLDHSQTDVVNTLQQAVQIIEAVHHPAIQGMFDFHNTPDESEPYDVLIKKYYSYIHHIHVQEINGKHMGTGTGINDYVRAFQALKDLKYKKWVSLEVFDFTPGAKTIAEESFKILKILETKLS